MANTHSGIFLANGDGSMKPYTESSGGGGTINALNDIGDVNIVSPSDGQALTYNAATAKWVNANASGGDASINAQLEVSPASASHSAGDYIWYNNNLYQATTAISIGDTLSVGTNIEVPTIADNTVVYIPGLGVYPAATDVTYSNSVSGLSATNVQSAIDEVAGDLDNKADLVHTQAASTISAGTLAGQVVANATAVATLGTAQVRNIYAGTTDMTPGTSVLATGDIYIVYEA